MIGLNIPKNMSKRNPEQRIGIVYHFFAHYRAAVMEELLSRGDFSYVLLSDCSDPDNGIKAWPVPEGAPFVRLSNRKLPAGMLWQSGLLKQVLRSDYAAFVFLANPYWPSTWIAALLARLRGKRVLFWTHGWLAPEKGIKRLLRNAFYRLPHGLLLYGQGARRRGISEGFAPDRLHVIYNSLDYQEQRSVREGVAADELTGLRRSLFGCSDIPVIVCPSRLTAVRRLDLLFYAVKRLADTGHETKILLVGDGPERSRLAALAAQLGLDVCFYGACYDEWKLGKLIMASTVTVAPGMVGLTAMHSLAYGVPVITHSDAENQMPEWEAVQDGVTGGLFQCGNVDSLASVILRWTGSSWVNADTRARCVSVIEKFYTPAMQRVLIERALRSEPPDDTVDTAKSDGELRQSA